jgi:cellulose synthase/poly-beta-1,6-N-acetylglucosamine synthase-like glycosyltransferase
LALASASATALHLQLVCLWRLLLIWLFASSICFGFGSASNFGFASAASFARRLLLIWHRRLLFLHLQQVSLYLILNLTFLLHRLLVAASFLCVCRIWLFASAS